MRADGTELGGLEGACGMTLPGIVEEVAGGMFCVFIPWNDIWTCCEPCMGTMEGTTLPPCIGYPWPPCIAKATGARAGGVPDTCRAAALGRLGGGPALKVKNHRKSTA